MPIARGAPNDCARAQLVGRQLASFVVASELSQRQCRRRAPREHGWVFAAERGMVATAAAQLFDRGLVVAGGGAEHARGVAQLGARGEIAVVANAGALDETAEGVRGLVALEAREHCR